MPAGATWTRWRRWPPLFDPARRPRRSRRWLSAPATCWTRAPVADRGRATVGTQPALPACCRSRSSARFSFTWPKFGFNVGYDLLTDHERAGLSGGGRSSVLKGGDVNAVVRDPRWRPSARPAGGRAPDVGLRPYSQACALAAQAGRHSAQRRSRGEHKGHHQGKHRCRP